MVNGKNLSRHLVKLINTAATLVGENKSTSIQCKVTASIPDSIMLLKFTKFMFDTWTK